MRISSETPGSISLAGLRMRPVKTSLGSVISADTLFEFAQTGHVVSARYAGGRIVLGVLAGIVDGSSLEFRYAQVDENEHVQGGRSECDIAFGANGRLQLTERFTWDSDAGSGVNVLEIVD